jgi:hypothetical protein
MGEVSEESTIVEAQEESLEVTWHVLDHWLESEVQVEAHRHIGDRSPDRASAGRGGNRCPEIHIVPSHIGISEFGVRGFIV